VRPYVPPALSCSKPLPPSRRRVHEQGYCVVMARSTGDNTMRRLVRSVATTKWSSKAKKAAEALKTQYVAGREGDESPATPIWPTPREQLEAFKRLFHASQARAALSEVTLDGDADEVADAMRGVDWDAVRAATAERTNEVSRAMRTMAEQVDWAKVQPIAAQVSRALIAAVAAGRIPVGGQLGPIIARTISDQNNLGRRVADNLRQTPAAVPPDFRRVIDTTATEQ
jgi:hypothetical protein